MQSWKPCILILSKIDTNSTPLVKPSIPYIHNRNLCSFEWLRSWQPTYAVLNSDVMQCIIWSYQKQSMCVQLYLIIKYKYLKYLGSGNTHSLRVSFPEREQAWFRLLESPIQKTTIEFDVNMFIWLWKRTEAEIDRHTNNFILIHTHLAVTNTTGLKTIPISH